MPSPGFAAVLLLLLEDIRIAEDNFRRLLITLDASVLVHGRCVPLLYLSFYRNTYCRRKPPLLGNVRFPCREVRSKMQRDHLDCVIWSCDLELSSAPVVVIERLALLK